MEQKEHQEHSAEEIRHMLLHALTEDSIGKSLEHAKSQQEAYKLMKNLAYFDLTWDEFQAGLVALQEG